MRPVILYGAECWTTGVKEENILEKTEMRMLRRIKGLTVKDKMKSEDIRKELGLGTIKSKARESRLRWFGHVHRREQENNLRQVMDMEIPGRRPRGRPRGRWRDLVDRVGTAGGARGCRRQKLLETTDRDRRPLPGIRREKSEVRSQSAFIERTTLGYQGLSAVHKKYPRWKNDSVCTL